MENARFIFQAEEVCSLAVEVEKKCAALSDDFLYGSSLLKIGIALKDVRQHSSTLYYTDRARTLFEAVGDHYHIAYAHHVISQVHHDGCRLPDALKAVEDAWKHAKLTASPYLQMTISMTFARLLFTTDQDTKAWKHIEIVLINASCIGDHLYVARAFEYMGYGYLRRGDYQNAYDAYEAAARMYIGTVDSGVAKVCKDNMVKIEGKQGNCDADAVVGFYKPVMEIDKVLSPPPPSPPQFNHLHQ